MYIGVCYGSAEIGYEDISTDLHALQCCSETIVDCKGWYGFVYMRVG